MWRTLAISTCFVLWGVGQLFAQDTLYVRARSAKLRAEKSASSKAHVVPKGTALRVLKKEGRYYQVQTADGLAGWVNRVYVTSKPPKKKGGLSRLGGSSSIGVQEASVHASIRGLQPVAEKYAKNKRISDQCVRDADKMQKMRVTEAELQSFMREGRLGEYGEGL